MPVQIQNDVDPVYEPVITIADTGEVLTEAQLYDTTIALANRIEYVRTLTPEAADRPETYCTLREDFLGAIYTSGQSRIDAAFPWRTSSTGSPAVNGRAGSAKNPGALEVALPGDGSTHEFAFYLHSATGDPFSYAAFEQLTVVLKIEHNVSNVANWVSFGFADDASLQAGDDDSFLIVFAPALNPTNWLLFKRVGGVQTITTLGSATFDNAEFAVWDIKKLATGQFRVYLNGVAQATVNAVDMPSGSYNLQHYQINTIAESELTKVTWDFISHRSKPDDRSGA